MKVPDIFQPVLKWLDEQHHVDVITDIIKHESGEAFAFYHLLTPGAPKLDTWERLKFPFDCFKEYDTWIKQTFNLPSDLPGEAMAGMLMSVSGENHQVHEHQDPIPTELLHHVRFNVMARKPTNGGNPVMDKKVFELEQNELWACEASNVMHSTDLILPGEVTDRVLISAGYCLTDEQLVSMRKQLLQDNSPTCFDELSDGLRRPLYAELPEDQKLLWEKEQFDTNFDPELYRKTYEPSHDTGDVEDETPLHMRRYPSEMPGMW